MEKVIPTEQELQQQIDKVKSDKKETKQPCEKALQRFEKIKELKAELRELIAQRNAPAQLLNDVISNGICPNCGEDLSVDREVKPHFVNHILKYNKECITIHCTNCNYKQEYSQPVKK